MKTVALILSLLACPAWAGSIYKSATVKIISSYQDHSVVFRGSGLGFQLSGQAYVVTSDHVVLHDNDAKTHQIFSPNGSEAEARYLLSDYGRGMALLEVNPTAETAKWPKLEALAPAKMKKGDTVAMMGYPAMSTGLVRDTSGVVDDLQKQSDLFIQSSILVEVTGGHAEFGMSGGVIADLQDGFVGLLSHQIYAEGSGPIQNTILAIPADQVLAWLQDYFAHPDSPNVTLVQQTVQQSAHDVPSLSTGTLLFFYVDAFGTGRRVLDILPGSGMVSKFYGQDLQRYADFFKAHDDCQIYVLGFRKRDEARGGNVGAGSLFGEIRSLNQPGLEPINQLFCNETADVIEKLKDLHTRIQSQLSKISQSSLTSEIADDLELIDDQDEYADNNSYVFLKPKDVELLLNSTRFSSDWLTLQKHSESAPLKALLQEWVQDLQYLTI